MFNKLTLFLFTVYFLNHFLAFGQSAPGYMGKKTLFSIGSNLSPAITGPNKNRETFPMAMNSSLNLNVERVTSRISSIGISYERFKTMVPLEFSISTDINSHQYESTDNSLISAQVFSFYYCKYESGVSPIGFYSKYGLDYISLTNDLTDVSFSRSSWRYSFAYPDIPEETSSNMIGINLGAGIKRAVSDKFFISFGAETTFPLKYLGYSNPRNIVTTSQTDIKERIAETSLHRIFKHQLINVSLAFGFLSK